MLNNKAENTEDQNIVRFFDGNTIPKKFNSSTFVSIMSKNGITKVITLVVMRVITKLKNTKGIPEFGNEINLRIGANEMFSNANPKPTSNSVTISYPPKK